MSSSPASRDVSIRTFANRIVAHATNAYSVCCIFLALLGVVWSVYATNLLWLSGAAAVFSLIPASYRTWREAIEQLPEVASIVVTCTTSVVDLPIDNRVPLGKGKVEILLAVSNPNDEPVYLTGVSLTSWKAPSGFLQEPLSVKLYGKEENGTFGKLRFPVKLESKSRRDDIALFAAIQAQTNDHLAFARSLAESEAVAIEFRVTSENASRLARHVDVCDNVPMNAYREMAFATWRRNAHKDLLEAAGASA